MGGRRGEQPPRPPIRSRGASTLLGAVRLKGSGLASCQGSTLGGVSTVAFHYHMYGSDMGELRVTNAAGQVAWSLSGDQGDAWIDVSVDFYSSSFAFEYTRGSEYTGDAAVAPPLHRARRVVQRDDG